MAMTSLVCDWIKYTCCDEDGAFTGNGRAFAESRFNRRRLCPDNLPMSFFLLHGSVIVATACALLLLGGGLYEYLVVDPFWPKRPDLIQPNRGGISRKRFWFPAHTLFEIVLILSLVQAWNSSELRFWLLLALASHVANRIWSALDFIPKALAFEKAVMVDELAARKWSRRSRLRFPLEVLTSVFLFAALWVVGHPTAGSQRAPAAAVSWRVAVNPATLVTPPVLHFSVKLVSEAAQQVISRSKLNEIVPKELNR